MRPDNDAFRFRSVSSRPFATAETVSLSDGASFLSVFEKSRPADVGDRVPVFPPGGFILSVDASPPPRFGALADDAKVVRECPVFFGFHL